MKRLLLMLFIVYTYSANAQSSIQPNVGLNLINYSILGISETTTYWEFGAHYEQALNNNVGLQLGGSYNYDGDLNGGFFELYLGGR